MSKNFSSNGSWRSKILIIVIILVLGLYIGYRVLSAKKEAIAMREETLEMATPAVTVLYPSPVQPEETIELPGNFVAWHQAPIYARVAGYVEEWYTDYGAKVKKGDLLAILNTPMIDAEYKMAEAEVAAKEAEYNLAVVTKDRYVGLGNTNAVSIQSVTVQQANEKVKKAELKKAEQELENIQARRQFKHIIAPFDGVIISRNVNMGDYVNETGSLSLKEGENGEVNIFTVADIRKMRLFVSVPEAFGPFLKPGLTADVMVPQFPDKQFKAKFLTSAEGFDTSTRTAITEFVIYNDDKDHLLWPGTYATVRINAPTRKGALVIPTTSMVFVENGATVAVVTDDNRVHYKPIKIKRIYPTTFQIEGISKNDRIIDNPSAALLEGDEVHIVNNPAKGYIISPIKNSGSEKDTAHNQQISSSNESSAKSESALPYNIGPYRFKVALKSKQATIGKNIMVIYLQDEESHPVENARIQVSSQDSEFRQQIRMDAKEVKPGVYGGVLEVPDEGNWPLTLKVQIEGDNLYQSELDITTGYPITLG
ncbi:efflux RND transporter periplasmic adaptor subunit [Candidatus Nitrosacidococcus tergens]|uniref:Efflux transporter, RND family, MFP subunit n=1 Tax=Candidatus Nitrosacidococcus tergens TaxID=553981 RepID=A0A7G1QAD1_9GAMM|nr:efflux RND transporter periplasmic adaptor subunit [Candidatus Nitrosacidococcus tergens]CAB1276444.1 Efflux transporter, RND family, MFP subunit [Candidatus Nitrosacidococcus tergens]